MATKELTKQERAFVKHLKSVCPDLAHTTRGGKPEYKDETILATFPEALLDWRMACWWAWQNPGEGVGVLKPSPPKRGQKEWVPDANEDRGQSVA